MRSSVRSFLPDLVVSPASRESEELACKFEAYRKNLKFTLNPTKRRLLRLLACYSAGLPIQLTELRAPPHVGKGGAGGLSLPTSPPSSTPSLSTPVPPSPASAFSSSSLSSSFSHELSLFSGTQGPASSEDKPSTSQPMVGSVGRPYGGRRLVR